MSDIPDNIIQLLDHHVGMEYELLALQQVGDAVYYFFDQYDDFSGETVIIKTGPRGPSVVNSIEADGLDAIGGAELPPKLQERLAAFRWMDETIDSAAGGASPHDRAELNTLEVGQARRSADPSNPLKSDQAAGTNGGRLACAWAVNRVTLLALGAPIGGGLSTADMFVHLKNKHSPSSNPTPGVIIISPTITMPNGERNIGHVGIVGNSNVVYSNSSRRARFEQNFTLSSWENYYANKGLSVLFFQLEPSRFPGPVA